ncbi:hypothetical protein [Sphingopyxis macrogoltabida]|uniref:Uncharacterized protein n=1 Tax=Sphingopyxis macrogoltabida TaxID=33050 RepID=A0A0N7I1M0_SPHMC|nr:hypothetical protein [Sphingopyxis macrogoltabida]ALJ14095.1 hypothetical protein LH19_14570 [Sphingopyxis macrogoltabida]ALJ15339.1 hypothetical protein LH19_20890 [Sphingopyxis macrogoltabida]AMU90365.1 hypothetical protein ATM17_15165 [Sphingopyxis macrogoltabida]AMU91588.1 hypothetical protein ATM17_21470 [Sphingopyxis macrogoltabida]
MTEVAPELLAMMVELLPTVDSYRDLSAMTGVGHQQTRSAMAPFVAIMKLQGTLPPCVCGKERFHKWGCVRTRTKALQARADTRTASPEEIEKRRVMVEAIMTGLAYSEIEKMFGMAPKTARKYLGYLTPEQREQRKAMEMERISPKRARHLSKLHRLQSNNRDREVPAMLVAGEKVASICAKTGMSKTAVYRHMTWLSPEQRAKRDDAIASGRCTDPGQSEEGEPAWLLAA